jgi:hypothetical protein
MNILAIRSIEKITRFLCRSVARFTPKREIERNGPYKTRYFLYGKTKSSPDEQLRIVLHRYYRGDPSGELHNHPWAWAWSLILAGGYEEERIVGPGIQTLRYRAGDVNRLDRGDLHRISVVDGETWTLFITGPRVNDAWTFWDPIRDIVRHHEAPREGGPNGVTPARVPADHTPLCNATGSDACCKACLGELLAKKQCCHLIEPYVTEGRDQYTCILPAGHEEWQPKHSTLDEQLEALRAREP